MKLLDDLSPDTIYPKKRLELEEITRVIRRVAGENIKMIILFGSYARGDWVNDAYVKNNTFYTYRSDFDILLVVENKSMEEIEGLLHKMEKQIYTIKGLTTMVSLIVHSIGYINQQLERGRYFYVDVKKDGIILYDSKEYELASPKKLTPREQKEIAEMDLRMWSGKARDSLLGYDFYLENEKWNKAAFELHQATEALFVAFLLVFGGYRPKCHNLARLLRMSEEWDSDIERLLIHDREEFRLLNAAYVDARFEESYRITKTQLEHLHDRVKDTQRHVESRCKDRIQKLA